MDLVYQEQPERDVIIQRGGKRRPRHHELAAYPKETGIKHTSGFANWMSSDCAYEGIKRAFKGS